MPGLPTCCPTSWHVWLMEQAQMIPVLPKLLHQLAWPAQPHPPLQHIHHPDPAPELPLARLKRKGLALALHPAPTPRRRNLSPRLPQVVKMAMTVTQHSKRTMSLKRKMRQTLTVEPQVTVKAQMAAALTGMVLAAVAKFQVLMARMKTLIERLMNLAVRLKSQTLKATPALQNLMMNLWPKQSHSQRGPQEATPTPPRHFHCLMWAARTLRRNGKFSSAKMSASWMRNSASGGTRWSARATMNGQSMIQWPVITQTPAKKPNFLIP